MKPNVVLEALSLDHAQDLYDLTEANREYLREWLPWLDSATAISDTETFIESRIAEPSGAPTFALFYNGNICGAAGFPEIDKQNKSAEIGYWLDQKHMGKGIVTQAVKELLQIGFGELNLNKIEIRCAVGNTKSRAIPERLGFTHEADLRACEWLYTKYVDHAVYSMLAEEFEAQ